MLFHEIGVLQISSSRGDVDDMMNQLNICGNNPIVVLTQVNRGVLSLIGHRFFIQWVVGQSLVNMLSMVQVSDGIWIWQ